MAKAQQSDNFIAYLLGLLIFVVACVAVAWFYFQYTERFSPPVNYSSFGPIVVRASTFSIKATIVVQTRREDTSWAKNHNAELDLALQTALANVDPALVKGAGGLAYVQGMLRDAADAALNTHNVQEILLTDFIIQSN